MNRDEVIDYTIKAAWHSIARMYNQFALRHGITTSLGFVLLNIDSHEGTPATKIAPLMGMESRSLTRILKSMEEKKLIVRKKDIQDGRLVKIFLTPLGKEKKEIAKATVRTFNQIIRETIPAGKLETFLEVIKRINLKIEEIDLSNYINITPIDEKNY